MIHLPFRRAGPHGDMIRGDLRIPEGPPPRTAVVVAHGFKGFKDWGFFPHLCEQLAAAGHAVVSFNFSWNGIGADDPVEFTELEAFGRNTYTRELEELLWMLEEVAVGDLMPKKPRGIGLVGHSRGGAQAILAAGESARVDALVTWSAVDHDLDGDDLLDDWAVLAGVPRRVVEKNRLLLLRLGIIGDGGQVEAMAMAVVQQMAVRLIKGRRSP